MLKKVNSCKYQYLVEYTFENPMACSILGRQTESTSENEEMLCTTRGHMNA